MGRAGAVRERSIATDRRVDLYGPCFNAAAQRLSVLETLIAQPCGDIERALPVMAEDHQALLGIEFPGSARRDLAHGDEKTAIDVHGGEFPWLPDVDEPGLFFFQEDGSFKGRNLVVQHATSLRPALRRFDPQASLVEPAGIVNIR